jgi:SAM-dependent methyltransferase
MTGYLDRSSCSLCSSGELEPCVRLPPTPLANEFVISPDPQAVFPLELVMCRACGHVQTSVLVDPARLFSSYLYETSTSPKTIAHLAEEAHQIHARVIEESTPGRRLREHEPRFLLEIGSNDGAFLEEVMKLDGTISPEHLLGVEPSETMSEKAKKKGVPTLRAFFGPDIDARLPSRDKWHVIVGNNVFAHVPNVKAILQSTVERLEPDGFMVIEVGAAADAVSGAFDVVYHEHSSYHSLAPLRRALENLGIPMFDVQRSAGEVGRGSLRIWAGKNRNPSRRMLDALLAEEKLSLDDPKTWSRELGRRSKGSLASTLRRLHAYFASWRRRKDSSIAGYGAPAKMTTLVYACDLPNVDFVAEDSSWKVGKLTPGRHVPVVARKELLERNPAAVIVFAWNFADQIARGLRKDGYGGEIYIPMPSGDARIL